jgi:hypothetical protein
MFLSSLPALAVLLAAGGGSSGTGDSALFTVLAVVAVIVVVLVAAFAVSRRRGRAPRPHQPTGDGPPAGDDPDPGRLAGGHAHFTPAAHERARRGSEPE